MPSPALHLLGGPTLFDSAGAPISGGPAQRHRIALLAHLVVAAPNGVSRDRLIGLLWPDRDGIAGRRLLNVAVTVLRQALGMGVIVTAGDDLRLDPEAIETDVRQFEHALDAGHLEAAVERYRGAFLEGFFLDDATEFERWVEAQRLRFARRYANALTVLAERATRSGDSIAAAGWWRALGHAEPTNPNIVLQLIDALVAIGDVTGALAAQEAHAAYMRGEVGVEPDARVTARGETLRRSLVEARRDLPVPRVAPVITPTGAPRAAIVRPRRRVVPVAAAGVAILLAAGATLAWRAAHTGHAGATSEAVTAILPIVAAPGTSTEMSESADDLLVLNLDQVDGIRIARVDPVRAAPAAGGRVLPADAGRALHAAFVISGRLAADSVSITATFAVLDSTGHGVGSVSVTQPRRSGELPALIDDASGQLLRLLWGRRWFVPAPKVAAASTKSIPALRAFLRGEAHFRAARWDSAAVALQQAVDLDSTFALAYLRLGEANAWRGNMGTPAVMNALDAAARFADRLPAREAALLQLVRLHEQTDYRAVAMGRDLLVRYPEDPDFRYYPADIAYHGMGIGDASLDSIYRLWDLAITADPVSLRPLEHVIDMALTEDDPARFDHYSAIRHARAPDVPDDAYTTRLVRWGSLAAARDSILSAAHQFAARDIGEGPFNVLVSLLFARCLGGTVDCHGIEATTLDAVVKLLAGHADWRIPERRYRHAVSVGRGRMDDHAVSNIWDLVKNAGIPSLFGYGDSGQRARTAEKMLAAGKEQGWRVSFWEAQLALTRHDTTAARAALDEANRRLRGDSATRGPGANRYSAGLDRAVGGWLILEAGDSAHAIGEIMTGLRDAGYAGYANDYGWYLHFLADVVMARYYRTRSAGIDRLEIELRGVGNCWPWLRLELARALDAEGDRARAADEYRRFALVWQGADPPLAHFGEEAVRRAAELERTGQ